VTSFGEGKGNLPSAPFQGKKAAEEAKEAVLVHSPEMIMPEGWVIPCNAAGRFVEGQGQAAFCGAWLGAGSGNEASLL